MRNSELTMFLSELATGLNGYGDKWFSGAQELENDLKKLGINIKLYYKYKLPDDMEPAAYMINYALNSFYADFYVFDYETNLDIYLEYKVDDVSKRKQLKQKIIDDIKNNTEECKRQLDLEYEKILKLNPELPRTDDRLKRRQVSEGAIFGFGPDEIRYFVTEYKGRSPGSEYEKLHNKIKSFGIEARYTLAPKTARMIIFALESRKQQDIMKNKERK